MPNIVISDNSPDFHKWARSHFMHRD